MAEVGAEEEVAPKKPYSFLTLLIVRVSLTEGSNSLHTQGGTRLGFSVDKRTVLVLLGSISQAFRRHFFLAFLALLNDLIVAVYPVTENC